MKTIHTLAAATVLGVLSTTASALTILDASTQCSAGNAANGIAIGNVSGNNGGATDCWGTFNGNDEGPGGAYQINGVVYDFIAKDDNGGGQETGTNIGLSTSPSGGAVSGTWEFDPNLFSPDAFLIVLKAANSPGFGVWLFSGADAASFSGDWLVAWGQDLSHLSVYAGEGGFDVPEPGTLALLGLGLTLLGFSRRDRR